MASFFDTFPAGLSKPGAAEFFGNLGAGLMAAGQTAPVGTNRVGLMAPYMQSAIAAPRKAQEQAMMAQLGQMQLAQAQQTQEQAAARKRFVGLMGNPTADPTQVRAGFMEAYPEQAAGGYAKQAFPEKKKPIVVNNRLVDPDTYQPVADFSDKPTGPFSGNAPFAQTYNLLVSYQQKKASNIPTTPEEDSAYGLAYQHALRPERFTLPTGELVERPGLNLAGFPALGAPSLMGGAAPTPIPGVPGTAAASVPGIPGATALAPAKPEKPTEGQSNAANYANRMTASDVIISGLEDTGSSMAGLAYKQFPDWANFARSEEVQKLDQAKRDFINASLRRESGATIQDSEFASADKQYFPQPGDSEAVIKQKRENRRLQIQGLVNAAGPAARKSKDELKSKYGLD
jgi:hypothetical protein